MLAFMMHVGHGGELHDHDFMLVVCVGTAVILSLAWRAISKQ
jgi:hypothetical protein